MSDRDSNDTPFSASERIAAQTQELVETVRANQRELDARVAETSELIDRTRTPLQDAEAVEQSFDGQRPEDS
jgi:hypothetical protein